MTTSVLDAASDTGFDTKTFYKGARVPAIKQGETGPEYQARIAAFRAKVDAKKANPVVKPKPVKPPIASIEAAIQTFAKRKVKGGLSATGCETAFKASSDADVTVTAKVQTNNPDLIEIFVTLAHSDWSAEFTAIKAKKNNARLWSATGADVFNIKVSYPNNAPAAVAWIDAA